MAKDNKDRNAWLIPMDFETYDFKQMEDEMAANDKISWQAGGKPRNQLPEKLKNKDAEFLIQNREDILNKMKNQKTYKDKMWNRLKIGDIVYFYILNLPIAGNQKSRILFRGEISDESTLVYYEDVYHSSNKAPIDEDVIYGFYISNLKTLNIEDLKDNRVLNLDYLKAIDPKFKEPRGDTNWRNIKINRNLPKNIYEHLEDKFKNSVNLNSVNFKALIEYFSQECYFKGKIRNESHKTFMNKNGLDYYEIHHFILQKIKPKNNRVTKSNEDYIHIHKLMETVDLEQNRIPLCPLCHRKIHNGYWKDRMALIEEVWKDSKIQDMLCAENGVLNDNEFQKMLVKKGFWNEDDPKEGVLEWIKSLY